VTVQVFVCLVVNSALVPSIEKVQVKLKTDMEIGWFSNLKQKSPVPFSAVTVLFQFHKFYFILLRRRLSAHK